MNKREMEQRNRTRMIIEEWHGEVVDGEIVGQVSDNNEITKYGERNRLEEMIRQREAEELAKKKEQSDFEKSMLPWLYGREGHNLSNEKLQNLVDPDAPKEFNRFRHNFVTYSAVVFAVVVNIIFFVVWFKNGW